MVTTGTRRPKPDTVRPMTAADDYAVRLGERIRTARERLGISRAVAARKMPGQASENDFYRWENGHNRPRDGALMDIAVALETTTEALTAGLRITPEELTQLDRIERIVRQIAAHHGIRLDDSPDPPVSSLDRPGPARDATRPDPGLPTDPPDADPQNGMPKRAGGGPS